VHIHTCRHTVLEIRSVAYWRTCLGFSTAVMVKVRAMKADCIESVVVFGADGVCIHSKISDNVLSLYSL